MPIFNREITFIHIPKCGGTSVERFVQDQGWRVGLFTPKGSVFVNGHTPQHCTYQELVELDVLTERVFTIVRAEPARVVSEFFYVQKRRPDLAKRFKNFDEFLELFLDRQNLKLFDYHNLPNREFLIDRTGNIDPRIKIFNFFDHAAIESYLGIKGLDKYRELRYGGENPLRPHHIKKIQSYFGA